MDRPTWVEQTEVAQGLGLRDASTTRHPQSLAPLERPEHARSTLLWHTRGFPVARPCGTCRYYVLICLNSHTYFFFYYGMSHPLCFFNPLYVRFILERTPTCLI